MMISIRDQCDDAVCAGSHAGRTVLGKLLALTSCEPSSPSALFLDFSEVEIATVSFLRESILAIRDFLRSRKSNYYPVLTNANQQIRDEFEIILSLKNEAFLHCHLESDGRKTNITVLGRLDEKIKHVLNVIQDRGEIDAGELQREFGAAEGVQQTAWNNRLAALAAAGLVIETSRGRAKRYWSLLKEG
ncbi:MAG TPA: hypothetical protein PKC48_11160 [Sphingorhabdus sp.]|nr:hypothetical protein [Sphingorhabdus sp.]